MSDNMNITDLDVQTKQSDIIDDINICELISTINKLNQNNLEKDEFINGYRTIKKQIEIVDSVIEQPHDNILNQISNLSIQELYEIMEKNSDKITQCDNFEINKMTANELRYLMIVSKLLDEKISAQKLNVYEIK